nr:hypothetical protein [Candidatus Sigynarchaeota archaeon]
TTTALVINLGNQIVNNTQAAFSATRLLDNSTENHIEIWNLGNMKPLAFAKRNATWAPTYEDMYTVAWFAADQQTLMNFLFNAGSLVGNNLSRIVDLFNFDPANFTIDQLTALNGSIGDLFGGSGTESNPLDNVLIRDIFVYAPDRMYMHVNGIPCPYAGISASNPISASMKPEYIGDFALYNLTVYTTVPLTGLNYTAQGNASIKFVQELTSILDSSSSGLGAIPSTAETGTVITLFVDATLLRFPQEGDYVSVINFTSDQGFVDTVVINYSIAFPRAKMFFDTQHNDLTGILTGDQRDMLMGSFYQFYEVGKQSNYDMDEYIIFNNYTEMVMQNQSLFQFYDAIIIADPEKGFAPQEIAMLMDYFNQGGKIIVLAEPDMGNSSLGISTGGLSANINFNFDFTSIRDLLSGAGNLPDSCNITGLSELVSKFGFTFNTSDSAAASISNFSTDSAITTGFGSSRIEMASYITFSITGNQSRNKVLARDSEENPVAAIHENPGTGGTFVLIGDSNMFDAYHLMNGNNSQFASNVFRYILRNELQMNLTPSRTEIHMGEALFIEADLNSTYPGVPMDELFGIVAYIHVESRETILLQFFPTVNSSFTTFLASGGLNLSGYYFPPFNNTGDYYALIIFNHPSVAGIYGQVNFKILPAVNDTQPGMIPPQAALQGVIIFSVSITIIVWVYFSARKKQEESMSVPELDAKSVREIDNLLMEMQSKLQIVSEEILYKKTEDLKTRLTRLEEKIKFFWKTVKKIKKFKKRMSRF